MKILFVYPRFKRHAEANPELLEYVPMEEYLGSPSLGIAMIAAVTPAEHQTEFRDDRLEDAAYATDADVVALSFFTAAASRGMELARYFKAQGKIVVAGGIFPTMMPDEVQPHVDAVFVGEGEGAWLSFLEDVRLGQVKPRYHSMGIQKLSGLPTPNLDLYFSQECDRFKPDDYPLQLSRGCSMSCDACALPTSMTRKLRCFDTEQAIAQLDQLTKAGKRACLTEDTSWFPGSSRRALEALLDHVIETDQLMSISYIGISMPMILVTPTRIFEKAKRAGVDMFYLVGGFDPITTKAFTGKNQKAWDRGVASIQKAWDVGIEPYTSFLLGNDQDDEGTVDRMLEFAEVSGIRKAEFAIATPYPGTPQWHRLLKQDRILHRDWSRYNDANMVFQPAQMTPDQVKEGYLRLWKEFYAPRQHFADLDRPDRTIQF